MALRIGVRRFLRRLRLLWRLAECDLPPLRLVLGEQDVILISFRNRVSDHEADRLQAELRLYLNDPHRKVLVLDQGAALRVLERPALARRAAASA